MKNGTLQITWLSGGSEFRRSFPLAEPSGEGDIVFEPRFEYLPGGTVFTLTLGTRKPVVLRRLSLRFTPDTGRDVRMMVNGYQSWTQSREVGKKYRARGLSALVYPLLSGYGDYRHRREHAGRLCSWSYTGFRRTDGTCLFYGSLEEKFAFTLFDFRFRDSRLSIEKELNDLPLEGECTPFRLFFSEGSETEVWSGYTSFFPADASRMVRRTGWTSWYSLYTRISEKSILEYLEAVKDTKLPLDVFQIDDGYQRAVGDWLETNEKFPNGMKPIADEIRKAGFLPGLWLSPFICERGSNVFRDHPDWILRDRNGRPVPAGWNYHWSGYFYALDPESAGVRDYLRKVFRTVISTWGFQMVKLDFLYAACLLHGETKSRGSIMSESMKFLRELAGDCLVLGCGVPLAPAWGSVDYCRIGSDVAPFWEDTFLRLVRYRERVSTINSLYSTLSRWQLSGRFFGNDPDVFILRNEGNRMTDDQKKTMFMVNNLLGRLVFFSDNPREYTVTQRTLLESMYPVADPAVLQVEETGGMYTILAEYEGRRYTALVNTENRPRSLIMDETGFTPETGLVRKGARFKLPPYKSLCFLQLPGIDTAGDPTVLGTSHCLPASDVRSVSVHARQLSLRLKPGVPDTGTAYVLLPDGSEEVLVNGTLYRPAGDGSALQVSVPYRDLVSS